MSRLVCAQCHKPIARCYCPFITKVDNDIELVIWQHPKEVNHPKGSIDLLGSCLSNVKIIVHEQLTFEEFETQCGKGLSRTLLSPVTKEPSKQLHAQSSPVEQLLIIDGSWRKARKIYHLNPWLADLPQIKLDTQHDSQYRIRKSEKDGQYSTLEAACLGLAQLENNSKYAAIHQSFAEYMNHLAKFYPHLQ